MSLEFVDHSLPNKPPPINPDSAKDNNSEDATDTYSGDSIGKIEDFLSAEYKDKQFREAWPAIKKKATAQEETQHNRFA